MFRLACEITIDGGPGRQVILKECSSLKVDSSWESTGDTARVEIPNKVVDQNGHIRRLFADNQLIRHGDRIQIRAGYHPDVSPEFEGFVTSVQGDYPIVVHCEDANYLLKRKTVEGKFEGLGLQEFLDRISPIPAFANVRIDDLGTIRVKGASVTRVLEETLRGKFGLVAFVRNGKLEAGVPYPSLDPDGQSRSAQARTDFGFGRDPYEFLYEFGNNIISDNLEWKRKDQMQLKVKAKSFLPDGEAIEVEVGDEEGAVRNFFRWGASEQELRKQANRFYHRLSYGGWSGNFHTFGLPRVVHGDAVRIRHRLTEREGLYKVKRVKVRYGMEGYRRIIEPDRRL